MKSAYELARGEIGTVEWRDGSNPKVVAYFKDSGNPTVVDDATAWCAAFVGAMLARAGLKGTGSLAARSYMEWGVPVALDRAQPGDIVVFKRGNSAWQGHVGFFVRQTDTHITVLGGNQSDSVNESRYAITSLLGVRRAEVKKVSTEQIVGISLAATLTAAAATWWENIEMFFRNLFGG